MNVMTKIEQIVKDRYEMACHNLMCYSATYGMDTAREGFEEDFEKALQEVQEVEAVMRHLNIER